MRKDFRALLLVLMIFMVITTVMITVVDYGVGKKSSVISLRQAVPLNSRELFTIEGSRYVRYLRHGVGIYYDGRDWNLQRISEVDKALNHAMETHETLVLSAEYFAPLGSDFDRDVMNGLGVPDDPECLKLPENITARTRELAYRITKDMSTPYEKVKAIQEFLKVKYRYDLDYSVAPEGWEPNDWFLFESRKGICGHFNSAFVVLVRAAGIPARLAYGYYLLPGDDGEPQKVYSTWAHAWAEVEFDGIGWLAFEATPD